MAYGDETVVPSVQMEGLQTVTPVKATDPRPTRRVSAVDPAGSGLFQKSVNVIIYYKKTEEEDSGWIAAGWIKESLGIVLADEPLLSGRLRACEDNGVGEYEVVSNDSGVRLIEAKFCMSLSEFLEKESPEGQLVFWKDIDELVPQFSPLLYVQVTNFECGGYSIGISCTLVLADIVMKQNFLKRWSDVHKQILSTSTNKTPIFYLPHLKKASFTSSTPIITSNQVKNGQNTLIYGITGYSYSDKKEIVLSQVEQTETELGTKMASKFPLYIKESSNLMKIDDCSKQVDGELKKSQVMRKLNWEDLVGASEIDFVQDNKPWGVKYWIGSVSDGVVVAINDDSCESSTSGIVNVIVSVPT